MAASTEGFATRYPAFAALSPDLLAAVMADAQLMVDDTWIAADIDAATYAYMAHLLTIEGHGGVALSEGGTTIATAGPATSVQVGDSKIMFSDSGSVSLSGDAARSGALIETAFGRRFLELRRRSFPEAITV